jgi:hypothetical protein
VFDVELVIQGHGLRDHVRGVPGGGKRVTVMVLESNVMVLQGRNSTA